MLIAMSGYVPSLVLLESSLIRSKGVFVNGVDQGLNKGIRTPAYNNGPPAGYANSPVKDLNSIDMRCNVLGDKQNAFTIPVHPGDNLTLDWHHDYRNDTDDIIASSHKGPAMVYLSPDPPTDSSFVKIWHEGLYVEGLPAGKWATTEDIRANHGKMNVRIPAGLKAGKYLLRAEMVGLHEADADYRVNPVRGAQFYPNCIQLDIQGDGDVELPEGVGFPGAYKFGDPGIVYDVSKRKATFGIGGRKQY
jgi:lytic cellulose monooxygenase (C1-hydroxylating)